MRGPASYRAMAPVLSLQRGREHMELRDTRTDQEIRGKHSQITNKV